jgi:hypothetical protein
VEGEQRDSEQRAWAQLAGAAAASIPAARGRKVEKRLRQRWRKTAERKR